MLRKQVFTFLLFLLPVMPVLAGEVSVAVAANFLRPLEAIVELFEKESGHTVVLSSGSSGRLYAQIVNGAPYDVFLSADQEKPLLLSDKGLTDPASQFTYATGTLVLWSLNENTDPYESLRDAGINRLAVANSRLAPYGKAAMQVLNNLGFYTVYSNKLVTGENINQVYQFVMTGNTDAGFIALSQMIANDELPPGRGWIVPQQLHEPIRQDAVLIDGANPTARQFFEFLKSQTVKSIVIRFGYKTD